MVDREIKTLTEDEFDKLFSKDTEEIRKFLGHLEALGFDNPTFPSDVPRVSLGVLEKLNQWIVANPEEAKQIIDKHLGQSNQNSTKEL